MDALSLRAREVVSGWGETILALANPSLHSANRATKGWPMVKLEDALVVVVAYLLFVAVGSTVMKLLFGRAEPATLKNVTVAQKFAKEPILIVSAVYNLAQVLLCGYMIYAALREYNRAGYKPICNAFNPRNTAMANVLWVFYLSKILDFVDTVQIVIRRKWRQLSFLHLYHHTTIFLMYWVNINAGYDGDIYYTIVLNSFIHLVMYSYYEATTFNIYVPKLLKQLVTNMQLIQFVTMMAQAVYILAMGCPYPHPITWVYLVYILSLFVLFKQFSAREYGDQGGKAKGSKKA